MGSSVEHQNNWKSSLEGDSTNSMSLKAMWNFNQIRVSSISVKTLSSKVGRRSFPGHTESPRMGAFNRKGLSNTQL